MLMKDFGTTVLACTPSYALYIAETMAEMNLHKDDFKLKYGILGAEPGPKAYAKRLKKN